METAAYILQMVFALMILWMLIVFFKQPLSIMKSFLRFLKPDDVFDRFMILKLPFFIPVWFADKLFKTNIYQNDFEKLSKLYDADYSNCYKYILVKADNFEIIEQILKEGLKSESERGVKSLTKYAKYEVANSGKCYYIRVLGHVNFNYLVNLYEMLAYSQPIDRVKGVKLILVNKKQSSKSLYFQINDENGFGLTGRSRANKKVFIGESPTTMQPAIFTNPEIGFVEYFNWFNFTFECERLRFKPFEIPLK